MSHNRPTRLFKVDKDAVKKDKNPDPNSPWKLGVLIEGDETEGKQYCAISHVWGKPVKPISLASIPWLVPVKDEDKLLFILRTCADQGYEYVWFDILCVNQKRDDADADTDQKRELPRMRYYFRDTVIVFGEDYRNFADCWDKVKHLVEVWEKDRACKEPDTRKELWQGLGDIENFVKDKWFWRVWTLQEAVLPSRLLTSNGATMDFHFCHLIDWTYAALGNEILNASCGNAEYAQIHPGAGVVNEYGWEAVSQGLLLATENDRARKAQLHPLEALLITKHRDSRYEIDKLRGAYGIIDEKWHVGEEDFEKAWQATVDKYIERREDPDLAPLVAMSLKNSPQRTWAAGKSANTEYMGSVVPPRGLINKTAKLDYSNNRNGALCLTASGVIKIKCAPNIRGGPYGDGSGELGYLISDILELQEEYCICSITSLLERALERSKPRQIPDTPQTDNNTNNLGNFQSALEYNANAVSSGLRDVFSGWNRWIVVTESGPSRAFLAWFPRKDENEDDASVKVRLDKCSLMWSYSGYNEWGVIVESSQEGYKKVGIAFVDSGNSGPKIDVVVV